MVVTIVDKSPTIIPGKTPKVTKPLPAKDRPVADAAIIFNRDADEGFTAIGKATLQADRDGELTGYTLGWIQMQLMETNWGVYRGKAEKDGSLLGNFGWNSKYPICRDVDSDPKAILYDATYDADAKNGNRFTVPGGVGKRIELVCEFRDFPDWPFPVSVTNNKTNKENYLEEALVELYFCTVLTLRSPDQKKFEHLKHVYWGIGWHCKFTLPDAKGVPGMNLVSGYSAPGRGCKVLDKGPKDVRVTDKLTATEVSVCNARMKERGAAPDQREERNAEFNTKRATRSLDGSTDGYDCFKK